MNPGKIKKKLGLIVNPLAGIGGRVGLKGSDGIETVKKAFSMGAKITSPARAKEALQELHHINEEFDLFTYPNSMGEDEAKESGFSPIVLGKIDPGQTTAKDTQSAAREMMEIGIDLIIFVGGDGTARDIYQAVGDKIVVLGIPSGVKIHSSVYAVNPHRASELVQMYLKGLAPVRDMDPSRSSARMR